MTIQSFAEDGAAKPTHVMLPPDAIQWKPFPPLGSGSRVGQALTYSTGLVILMSRE